MYTTAVGTKRTPKKTEVGRLVHEKRLADKLSLRRAANAADIEHSGLSELERGLRKPDFETIVKLHEGLGIPLDGLAVAAARDLGHEPANTDEAFRALAVSLTARAQMFPDLKKILDRLNRADPVRYRAFLVMFQMWEQEDEHNGEHQS